MDSQLAQKKLCPLAQMTATKVKAPPWSGDTANFSQGDEVEESEEMWSDEAFEEFVVRCDADHVAAKLW